MPELWRVVYRHIDDQNWSQLGSKIYHAKGTASGVMKRHARLEEKDWDDVEKVWIRPGDTVMYRIQSCPAEWKDYEKN